MALTHAEAVTPWIRLQQTIDYRQIDGVLDDIPCIAGILVLPIVTIVAIRLHLSVFFPAIASQPGHFDCTSHGP